MSVPGFQLFSNPTGPLFHKCLVCKSVAAAMAVLLAPPTIQMHLEKLKYLKLTDRSGSVQRVMVQQLTWMSSLCNGGGGGKVTVLISYQSTIHTHAEHTEESNYHAQLTTGSSKAHACRTLICQNRHNWAFSEMVDVCSCRDLSICSSELQQGKVEG